MLLEDVLQGGVDKILYLYYAKKGIKMTIIFMWDWDGTLANTMPAHADLAAKCIQKHFEINFQSAREQYLNTTGIPFDYQLKKIFPEEKESKIISCAEEYHKEKMIYVYENPKEFPEALKVVKKLQDNENIYQMVSSSTEEGIINKWAQKNEIGIMVLGRESGSKNDHIIEVRKWFPRSKIIFISDSHGDMSLPVEITLGVDVPSHKEQIFWDNGAHSVSFEPVNLKWLEEIKEFLVE